MKQFKNLILAGALVVGLAGFAVSCNKYGDDIDEIRAELNKLATKDDVASQIASLQSALSTAQSAASEAKAAADKALADAKAAGDVAAAAKAAADKAAAEAKEAVLAEIEEKLGALQEQLESVTEDALAEVAKAVEDAKKELEEITGSIADAITSIDLVSSYTAPFASTGKLLMFSTAFENDAVFAKDMANAITFTKGTQVQIGNSFYVRVSPTNAELTPSMISLVNSQGENLDGIVKVSSVKRVNGLLTGSTKAAENSGLWVVNVELENYDKATFEAAAYAKVNGQTKHVLFAVQANNTSYAETRYATSTFDLEIDWQEYVPEKELFYWVNDKFVAKINNRYDQSSKSFKPSPNTAQNYVEKTWYTANQILNPIPAVTPIWTGANVNVQKDENDNRSAMDVYPAVQGEWLTIGLYDEDGEDYNNVRALYVVLDKENAVESAPSELNAWTSYEYDGLNTVVDGNELKLKIDSKTAINDIIGFRVYAVNYDGTLVDPDGKAFYVQLGTEGVDWNAVATTIVPQNETVAGTTSSAASMTATKLTGAHHFEWTTDKIGTTQPVFHATFQNANNQTVFATNGTISSTLEFEKITKVVTTPANINDWKLYEDNKAYTGTLTIFSESNHVLATVKVTMTKVLPTGAPEGFSPKTNQIVEGVWNGYLVPIAATGDDPDVSTSTAWTNQTAYLGAMRLSNVFNYGKGDPTKYVFTFATSKKNGNNVVANVVEGGEEVLEVEPVFIDNATKHTTTVEYNYGLISSVKYLQSDGVTMDYKEYKVTAYTFESVYNDLYNTTYTWRWAERADLNKRNPRITNGELGITGNTAGNNANFTSTTVTDAMIAQYVYTTSVVYGAGSDEKDASGATVPEFTIDLTKAIYGASSRDGIYNAFFDPSYEGSVKVATKADGTAKVTLTSDANEVEEYFTVELVESELVFKPQSGTTNPTADVPSTLTIYYTDMYNATTGHKEHFIKLPMTVKKR